MFSTNSINSIYNYKIIPVIKCNNNLTENNKSNEFKKKKNTEKKELSFKEVLKNQLNKKV